jgi:hypothetical protein
LAAIQPYIYEQPNSSGTVEGVCFRILSNGNATPNCFTGAGVAFGSGGGAPTVNTALGNALVIAGRTYGWLDVKNPIRIGSKILWASTSWQVDSSSRILSCYDVATSAACTGWPVTNTLNYTLSLDPYNSGCVWKNDNDGNIRSYTVSTGALTCGPPDTAAFSAQSVLTDLTCGRNGLSAWQSIAVSGTTFTSATLTVKNAGTTVSGWNAVPFVSGAVDLSTLTVANSGTNPTFEIAFTGRNNTAPVVTLTSVSGTPQLCLTMHPQPGCPVTAGQYSDPLPTASAVITGAGTATTGGGTETFANGTATVTQASATAAQCLGTIQGTTTVDGTPTPVPGVVVTLADSGGATIATATTDANGFYSFPGLAAITGYKVSFGGASGLSTTSSTAAAPSTPRAAERQRVDCAHDRGLQRRQPQHARSARPRAVRHAHAERAREPGLRLGR